MTPEQKTAITPHVQAAKKRLDEAMQELHECLYACNAADLSVNQLLDEGKMSLVSIISDIATLKAVQMDVAELRAWCEREQS